MARKCPKCSLLNPENALRCDCGYDFPSGTMKSSYLQPEEEFPLLLPATPPMRAEQDNAAPTNRGLNMIELSDRDFNAEVISSPLPVLVHFTQGNEFDKRMTQALSEVTPPFSSRIRTGVMHVGKHPKTANEFAVTMTPALLFFRRGQVVAFILGVTTGETISQRINQVLRSTESELPHIARSSLAKAFKSRRYHGQWDQVILSGLACGAAYGIASTNLSFGGAFMVGAFAYGFLILNPNMGFSPVQKLVGTGLMLSIASYGGDILKFISAIFFQH